MLFLCSHLHCFWQEICCHTHFYSLLFTLISFKISSLSGVLNNLMMIYLGVVLFILLDLGFFEFIESEGF